MNQLACSEIRESIAGLFADRAQIAKLKDYCVVTLPLQTVDNRHVSLIVEQGIGDTFLVHDGGKTESALFAQGVNVTQNKLEYLRASAGCYGVTIADNHLIQKICKLRTLNATILEVAQCAILTSQEIIGHKVSFEEENIARRLKSVFADWHPPFLEKVVFQGTVHGETATHNFPVIAFPKRAQQRTVAIKVLYPSHPQWQAERYGFLVHDIRSQPIYGSWVRMAVISRSDEWPKKAVDLVRNLSHETIEIPTGTEIEAIDSVPSLVADLMTNRAA